MESPPRPRRKPIRKYYKPILPTNITGTSF
jgi:hypothetical protein